MIKIEHRFVEFIPEQLDPGILYVSMQYATVAHLCCCGCGNEVVTPLAPSRWRLIFDGRSISLTPSIGNWSFACQAHYWIRANRVHWAERFTADQIERIRVNGRWAIEHDLDVSPEVPSQRSAEPTGWLRRRLAALSRWRSH